MPILLCMHLPCDDAFTMKKYILKPYPFRDQPSSNCIFNYRLSKARQIVENSFGIIANKFQILRRVKNPMPKVVTNIALAMCTLIFCYLQIFRINYLHLGLIDTENEYSHELGLDS